MVPGLFLSVVLKTIPGLKYKTVVYTRLPAKIPLTLEYFGARLVQVVQNLLFEKSSIKSKSYKFLILLKKQVKKLLDFGEIWIYNVFTLTNWETYMNYLNQVAELRSELVKLRLSDLRRIADTEYNMQVSEPVTKKELLEEIISEEYRIACK
jgi:hypothetical protein